MTNEETIKIKMQREQQAHELKLTLINAFAKDPELKYYVGVAVGSGVAGIATLFGQTAEEKDSSLPTIIPDWAFLISPGLMASPAALPNWMKWKEGGKVSDPFDMLTGIIQLGGLGFGGFCASVLILKAMFGEGGMAEVLKGIGEIVPG